eukprot:1745454-Amphidinium_carterae.1
MAHMLDPLPSLFVNTLLGGIEKGRKDPRFRHSWNQSFQKSILSRLRITSWCSATQAKVVANDHVL